MLNTILKELAISAAMGVALGIVIQTIMALTYEKSVIICNTSILMVGGLFFIITTFKVGVTIACLSMVFMTFTIATISYLKLIKEQKTKNKDFLG